MLLGKGMRWLLIALIWLLAILVLAELGLRAFRNTLPPRLQEMVNIVVIGTPFAEHWQRAWIRNPDHYFILRPGLDNALQFGTPRLRFHLSTIELWEGGGIGFRNRPVDYSVDAVVVGDSFAFCFTEREDCWVSHLERSSGLGIVNLGLPATGSHSHYLVLKDFGQHFKPPLVIWQFFGNDFNDDYGLFSANESSGPLEEIRDPDLELALEQSAGRWLRTHSALFTVAESVLTGRRRFVDPDAQQFEERYAVTLSSGERLRFGQTYEPRAMDMSREVNQAGFQISRSAFESALDLTTSWGGKLVVVLVPTREEAYEKWTASEMGDELEAIRSARVAMHEICAALDLLCYDVLKDLQARTSAGGLLYYEDDLHLNPQGNSVLAELVGDWLAGQDLLPS